MSVSAKFIEWIRGKMSNSPRDSASEAYIYFDADHVIVTPTICLKTFRGPALPSDVFPSLVQVATVSQSVLEKLGECQWCETETEFDSTVAAFFANHKIKGWSALPLAFEHIAIRQVSTDSLLVTCYEIRSGDGYVSEHAAVNIGASSTALEKALGECFDLLRGNPKPK